MEKIFALMHKQEAISQERFCDGLLGEAADLKANGALQVRICVADDAVAAAAPYRIVEAGPGLDAMVSFWLPSVRDAEPCLEQLKRQDPDCYAYLVTESEPLIHEQPPGERTAGMNQVVTLKKPARLSYQSWLDIWLKEHTPLAIDIQATFGYRQNVVVRHLRESQPEYTAIVEENFPAAAMSSRPAFYDAVGDDALYEQREQEMMASAMRFIDFDEINCIPMSEYNF